MRNLRGWIILLLSLSLMLRLGFIFWGSLPVGMVQDGFQYDLLAKSILHDGMFPSGLRSPGYPFFVAVMYQLFGETPIPIFVFQAILSTLSVGLLFILGREALGKERTLYAFIAAAMIGLNPDIAAYSVAMLRESLTLFLILLSAMLCLRMLMRDWRYGIGLGFAMAGLAYLRQEACLLVCVMMVGGDFTATMAMARTLRGHGGGWDYCGKRPALGPLLRQVSWICEHAVCSGEQLVLSNLVSFNFGKR